MGHLKWDTPQIEWETAGNSWKLAGNGWKRLEGDPLRALPSALRCIRPFAFVRKLKAEGFRPGAALPGRAVGDGTQGGCSIYDMGTWPS